MYGNSVHGWGISLGGNLIIFFFYSLLIFTSNFTSWVTLAEHNGLPLFYSHTQYKNIIKKKSQAQSFIVEKLFSRNLYTHSDSSTWKLTHKAQLIIYVSNCFVLRSNDAH